MATQITLGVTGMGGYAGHMLEWFLSNPANDLPARPVAVCEPEPEQFPELSGRLVERGIEIVRNYDQILQRDIDAVYLPIPIPLHRQFVEQSLSAGKAVLCEKPAAGCINDIDAMIAARDRARLPAAIAFQHVYQPKLWQLKRRIVGGEFGMVRRARVLACWPRDEAYFTRNDWAGRNRHNGQWVLDSPANNAMSHYIHLCLFLLGPDESHSASPIRVEAELYRANAIENYDTCSLRIWLHDQLPDARTPGTPGDSALSPSPGTPGEGRGGGVARNTASNQLPVLIHMTHATDIQDEAEITIVTDHGQIHYGSNHDVTIHHNGKVERLMLDQPMQLPMFTSFAHCVRDGIASAEIGTLEMARCHGVVISAASEAAPVISLKNVAKRIVNDQGKAFHVVAGINQALRQSIEHDQMLHESHLAPWSHPAAVIDTAGYRHFNGPARGDGNLVPSPGTPGEG